FFFSSRRRHTRFSRDWSSDVCSSDLCSPWFVILSSGPVSAPVAAVAAISAVTPVATIPAVTPVAAIPAVALVALLHLDRGAVLVGVHLHRHDAHDVVVEPGEALHLLHRGRGRVGAEIGIVTLAVLVDLVGYGLHAPVLVVDDLAAVVREDGGEVFDEAFGLRVGQVLARDEDMLVKRHVVPFVSGGFIGGVTLPRPATRGFAGSRECGRMRPYR